MSDESTKPASPRRRRPAHPPVAGHGDRPVIVFATVCTAGRKRILANDAGHAVILAAWREADAWAIGRYVIMPDHIHLFCSPGSGVASLSRWVQYWKAVASRLWPRQEERPIWQASFWDRQLRHDEGYAEKWEYVKNNPVRHGLVSSANQWAYAGELNQLRL